MFVLINLKGSRLYSVYIIRPSQWSFVCVCGACYSFSMHKYSYTDAEQPDGDELTIDYYDDLYCPACDKSFKSDKAWVTPHPLRLHANSPPMENNTTDRLKYLNDKVSRCHCLHSCWGNFLAVRFWLINLLKAVKACACFVFSLCTQWHCTLQTNESFLWASLSFSMKDCHHYF